MFGFIYITTNLINNKHYVGQRKIRGNNSDNLYLGSGKLLTCAIRKYGKENFVRETLFIYPYTEQGELDAFN